MDLNLILSFFGASILLTLMPGPDILLVLTESVSKGSRNGVALASGLCTGVLVHTLLAATGLSMIIQNSDMAFQLIKYLGGGYLIYLALITLREKRGKAISREKRGDDNFLKLAKKGFLMNVLNPKVSLFFIAFLPQFISRNGLHISIQMVILGLLFMVQALFIFTLVAHFAGKLSPLLNSDRFWKVTKYVKVLVLSVLGLLLIISGR